MISYQGCILLSLIAAALYAPPTQFSASASETFPEGSGSLLIGGQFYTIPYQQINKYLIENVSSKDVSANIEAAKKWLETDLSENVSLLKRPLAAALRQFVALADVANKCDMESYVILYRNHKGSSALENRAETRSGPSRRIDNIIYQVSMAHAKHCQSVYEKEFESKQLSMDEGKFKAIKAFANDLVSHNVIMHQIVHMDYEARRRAFGQGVLDVFVNSKVKSLKEDGPKEAYEALVELTKGSGSRQYLARIVNSDDSVEPLNRSKLTELYNTYIVEPCEYYVNEVSDLFQRAKFDGMWKHEFRNCYAPFYENYYYGWGSFEVCKRLLKRDKSAVLKGVISIAEYNRLKKSQIE